MPETSPNILVIGAGAVGQIYGRHLSLGGARVSFYVKEKYLESLEKGMPFFPLNRQTVKQAPVQFSDFKLLWNLEQVSAERFDQVWLCVASPALRADWLEPMLKAVGDADIVTLVPGIEDRELLLQHVPANRLVCGIITLIGYQAPLPEQTCHSPGMAYWFPPGMPAYFSGPTNLVESVVKRLRKGGQPAASHKDVTQMGGSGTAIMMPLLLGLERESWSFHQFSTTTGLRDGVLGAKEALSIVSAKNNQKAPFWLHFLMPALFRSVLWFGERIVPLPLETYLKYHFTKVGSQTRQFIDTFIRIGHEKDLPTGQLEALRNSVPANAPTA